MSRADHDDHEVRRDRRRPPTAARTARGGRRRDPAIAFRGAVAALVALAFGLIGAVHVLAAPAEAGRPGSAPIAAFATIDPLAWFVERIGGDRVTVEALVAGGECAETYEATPKQMARLSNARLYFAIGMPMEETLLPRLTANAPGLVVVDVRHDIPLRHLEDDLLRVDGGGASPAAEHDDDPDAPLAGRVDHQGHDHDHDHAHAGVDPHIWLSPRLAKILAANVAAGLVRVDPEHADLYRANLGLLEVELDDLDRAVAALLLPVRGRDMLVYHPFYGYFCDAYGLKQVAVEVGGFKPGSKYLASVIEWARARGVHAVFIQIGPSAATATILAREIGGQVIPLDPLARDYPANLRLMAQRIRDGLSGPPPGSRG